MQNAHRITINPKFKEKKFTIFLNSHISLQQYYTHVYLNNFETIQMMLETFHNDFISKKKKNENWIDGFCCGVMSWWIAFESVFKTWKSALETIIPHNIIKQISNSIRNNSKFPTPYICQHSSVISISNINIFHLLWNEII